ncbi:hypothetical protein C9F11_04825 [Streptomyces sp. YIM 121038]|nr:hypothetical protein C9F11_04825 [Streptomyces sp. YIM 121038]
MVRVHPQVQTWGRWPATWLWWNFIGRTQADIEQARTDWMTGTRFGEVKGYDGAPLPAPELPPVALKPRGAGALNCRNAGGWRFGAAGERDR